MRNGWILWYVAILLTRHISVTGKNGEDVMADTVDKRKSEHVKSLGRGYIRG